jgi:hypothetical protein
MAHYAFIDENGTVTEVIAGREETEIVDGISDWEAHYSYFRGQVCARTSYNTLGGIHYTDGEPSEDQTKAFRFNYAGIGHTYDADRDAFIPPTPYPSWVLDEATCLWVAPINYPTDGEHYVWDEENTRWSNPS